MGNVYVLRLCNFCNNEIFKRKDAVYCSENCRHKASSKRYRDKNFVELKVKRLSTNSDYISRMYSRVKSRAKQKGISFNIDKTDIIIPEFCPVLGIKLVPKLGGKKGYYPDSPSLDRIKPSLGYIKDNIRVISARANLLKNDASIDELEKVLSDLKSITNE